MKICEVHMSNCDPGHYDIEKFNGVVSTGIVTYLYKPNDFEKIKRIFEELTKVTGKSALAQSIFEDGKIDEMDKFDIRQMYDLNSDGKVDEKDQISFDANVDENFAAQVKVPKNQIPKVLDNYELNIEHYLDVGHPNYHSDSF